MSKSYSKLVFQQISRKIDFDESEVVFKDAQERNDALFS